MILRVGREFDATRFAANASEVTVKFNVLPFEALD
jgi:hypothetical protein